jgi:hypothetical protein
MQSKKNFQNFSGACPLDGSSRASTGAIYPRHSNTCAFQMNKTERARCEALHAHKAVHGHLTELVLHQNTSNTTEPPCIPPAIRQFPKPLIGPEQRKHGGIIVHIIVAVYTFLGLAIVCDEYFVASLDRICEGTLQPLAYRDSTRLLQN